MRKFIFILFGALLSLSSYAEEISIEGSYYTIDQNTHTATLSKVTWMDQNFKILSSIEKDGETYKVTAIGDRVFKGLYLHSITIPEGITTIGNYAFCGNSFTELKLPSSLEKIGEYSFSYSYNLEEITIPEKIDSIPASAFAECSNLQTINLPSNLKYIGIKSFLYCFKLNNIVFPNNLKCIDRQAFQACNLSDINIPENVDSIGYRAFSGCRMINQIVVAKNNKKYDSRNNCNALIETKSNKLIRGCSSSIIENSINCIEDEAFDGSTISEITIPASVMKVKGNPFSNCLYLTKITVDNNNKYYDSRDNCNAILEIKTNELTSGCKNSIIPKNTKSIRAKAFIGSRISQLDIPEGVESIGTSAFSECTALKNITLGSTIASIGDEAFYDCSNLNDFEFPSYLKYIGKYAFMRCSNLYNVDIPEGVTEISESAFMYSGLINITLPNSLTKIGKSAFWNCQITKLPLAKGLKEIGDQAFCYCYYLKEVSLPSTIEKIGSSAFEGDGALNNIYSYISDPSIVTLDSEKTPFAFTETLYVPKGKKAIYQQTNIWKEFQNIIEMDDETTTISKPNSSNSQHSIYNIAGLKVNGNTKGITIVKLEDGTTRKILNK